MEDIQQAVDSFVTAQTRETSAPFVGQWWTLISTTNWQKGEIICNWRKALIDQGASVREYADEAWSELAGDISPQHVGRLRRVYERFHQTWRTYDGLYWTHFLVAYDWPDAEMWLEGALQNDWSVAQMRRQRTETLGSVSPNAADDADLVPHETSEELSEHEGISDIVVEHLQTIAADQDSGKPAGNKASTPRSREPRRLDEVDMLWNSEPVLSLEDRPALDELPSDFSRSLDHLSAAIRKHKEAGWVELNRDVVLAALESLRLLVLD